MKLKNFNWDEQAIDTIVSDNTRYTTYDGYGSLNYPIEPQTAQLPQQNPPQVEELSSL